MNLLAKLFSTAIAAFPVAGPATATDIIGVTEIAFTAPERGAELTATVWYPAAPGGDAELVGENGVFVGSEANRDAPIATGHHPLILMSHGGFRAAPNTDSWIAAALAREGFVIATAHPPSRGLKAKDALQELRLRPADLSALLTALGRDTLFADAIDEDRVGALGFLLGGTSVLALTGARVDPARFADFCRNNANNPDCAWFERSGVDVSASDSWFEATAPTDPRIKSVVAVAPEFADAFDRDSLTGIQVPGTVISLGQSVLPEAWGPATTELSVDGATPFDVFNECKAGAVDILREEDGDERLCTEETSPRADIHASMTLVIISAYDDQLPSNR